MSMTKGNYKSYDRSLAMDEYIYECNKVEGKLQLIES